MSSGHFESRPGEVRAATGHRSVFVLALAIAAAALLSLAAVVYLAWTTERQLQPLQAHLNHVHKLQEAGTKVQSALIRELAKGPPTQQQDIDAITASLNAILRAGGSRHAATPDRIRAAKDYLVRDGFSHKDNLLAANGLLAQTIVDEGAIQRGAIQNTRQMAWEEAMTAGALALLIPMFVLLILLAFRRRFYFLSSSLIQLLDNVRDERLDPLPIPPANDVMAPVIERFNAMTERLRATEALHGERQQNMQTHIAQVSDAMLRTQVKLAQAQQLSAIGEVSARIAHEVRNPLSGIAMAVRNLAEESDENVREEVTALILEEIARIERLLHQILGNVPRDMASPAPTNIGELCRDMVKLLGFEADEQLRFALDTADEVITIAADRLRQILLNVIRNAMQAMRESGRDSGGRSAGTISIQARFTDDQLTLTISDTGPGFPEDIITQGIRPFRSDQDGGAGLGLSIVQRLVQQMSGRLALSNSTGGGAQVAIFLPATKGASAP